MKLLPKGKELKLKVVFQMGGGGKDGLNYPFVRLIRFHRYALKLLPMNCLKVTLISCGRR